MEYTTVGKLYQNTIVHGYMVILYGNYFQYLRVNLLLVNYSTNIAITLHFLGIWVVIIMT